jgi:hypothetical protein
MQSCKKCRKQMEPQINLDGKVADILRKFATETEMRWSCPGCGAVRGSPLKPSDIADVAAYVRRQKKKWWQFWVR